MCCRKTTDPTTIHLLFRINYRSGKGSTLAIAEEPVLTDVYDRAELFRPIDGSAYVFAKSVEQRSEHDKSWLTSANVRVVEIVEEGAEDGGVAVGSAAAAQFPLRSEAALAK